MSSQNEPESMPNFDYIRLFLALEVWFIHLPVSHRGLQWLVLPINPVPAFVAVSGYLVFRSLKRHENTKVFWISRGLRVLPAFCLALVFTYLVGGNQALQDSLFSYLYMKPVISGPFSNFALWSLLIEELLYLSLILLYDWGVMSNPYYNRVIFWAAATVFGVQVFVFPYHPASVEAAYFAILMSFFGGTFMVDSPYLAFVKRWWPAFLAASALGAFTFPFVAQYRLAVSFLFVLASVGGAFGVIGFSASKSKLPRLKYDLSYGIYVYHLPCMFLCDRLKLVGVPFIITSLAMVLTLSALSWKFLESPALELKKRWTAKVLA